jgi:hypothetical protein
VYIPKQFIFQIYHQNISKHILLHIKNIKNDES